MHIGKYLLLALLCAVSTLVGAQSLGSIRGTVRSDAGGPALSLTVRVQNTPLIAISDNAGAFVISNVAPGSYTLEVTGLGYKPTKRAVVVAAGKETTVALTVAETSVDMAEVTVLGRTEAQEVNRQAFNVTAVEATKLYNTTLDLAGALDRVAGVRVRESGGVGSNFNLSINGFSGNRVRYFIDGIPMDNFGSSFQINNIPINVAERIEVYKGVVPIWLGSDALAGAINIVTGDRYRNYVDASYSYGSFNTHRSVVNAAVTSKSGLTAQVSAFQNYSDNNYKVTVDAADIYTGQYTRGAVVPRFHDTYHNETLIANVGLVGKRYADKLLLGLTVGKNYKEIQTGARMVAVFGGRHSRGSILMPTLKYKKEELIKGLDVTLNANYNFGSEQIIDTVNGRYDWYGTLRRIGTGGEYSRTLYKYNNNNGLVTGMLNYRIGERQALALSNVFNTFNREGADAFNPALANRPQKTQKNVLGLGYTYNVKEQWSAAVFGKVLRQGTWSSATAGQATTTKVGYGLASTYFFTPALQAKASYELANRLPEATEMFGDPNNNQDGNPQLRPESSHNVNLGLSYTFPLNEDDRFLLNANAVYRYATDFIYQRLNQNQGLTIPDNRKGVQTFGGDGEIRYTHKNTISIGANLTYQYLQNRQKYDAENPGSTGISAVYLDQMPNIPYLFGNANASVLLPNIGGQGNSLTLGYNLLYVYNFWLYWPSQGGRDADSEKRTVPSQLSHDLNAVYSLRNGRYNLGVEVRNLTNALLYDNFSLQKPGRGFYVNVRYFMNQTSNQ